MITRKEMAIEHEILRGEVGSVAHGTNIVGQDDRDEMGIYIEPMETVICDPDPMHSHYVYRTKPDGVRSEAGDLDLVCYSLRKFCHLAVKGNPSVLLLLWLPRYLNCTYIGMQLITVRRCFISRHTAKAYVGYVIGQKDKLLGKRSPKVSRPELVKQYGYDTKFAMHALRLCYQGIELLRTGNLTIPVPEPERSILLEVRHGRLTLEQCMMTLEYAEDKLMRVANDVTNEPDVDSINKFLVDSYRFYWSYPNQGMSAYLNKSDMVAETVK